MWKIILLAVIQGIAEFLPISSSGHLLIFGEMLGISEDSATVSIALHAGTLASILVVYWQRIVTMIQSDRRVVGLLIVGTIPAATIGFLIKTKFDYLLESPLIAGFMLLITGMLVMLLKYLPEARGKYQHLSWAKSFEIGLFQAVAVMPGLSRSGSTIVGGRMLGLSKDDAVTFSFLLAIPAILGAVVLESKSLLEAGPSLGRITPLLIGAATSFLVGIVALRWLIRWSQRGQLHLFAYWCVPVGLGTIIWQLWPAGG